MTKTENIESDELLSIVTNLHHQYILLCRTIFLYQTRETLQENKKKQQHLFKISDGMHNLMDYHQQQDKLLLQELKQLQSSLSEGCRNKSIWQHEQCAFFCIEEMNGLAKRGIALLENRFSQRWG